MNEREKQKLELLRQRFLEWMEAINYSPKTRVNYARDVRLFLEWIAGETELGAIAEVTSAHIQQYQLALFQQEGRASEGEAKPLSLGAQAKRAGGGQKVLSVAAGRGDAGAQPIGLARIPQARTPAAAQRADPGRGEAFD